jgi:hypothetical protein
MSAFVMGEKFFDQLAAELFAHASLKHSKLNWPVTHCLELRGDEHAHVERKIREFVQSCFALNVAAVNCRYGENEPTPTIKFTEANGVTQWSDVQLFKYLECLSYQCAEDVAEISTAYEKLERLIGAIARTIVGASDGYDVARWDWAA